jgi:hypothetical protein
VSRLFQSILHSEDQAKRIQEEVNEEGEEDFEWTAEDEIEQALEDYPFLDT